MTYKRCTILFTFLVLLAYHDSSSSVLAQVELCRNTDWVDEDGCGCDEYDFNQEWCGLYGEFVFEGSSANEACCACGGGRTIFIDGTETDPPIVIGQKNCILSPPVEVAPGLTVENWVDNDGLEFRMRITYEGKSWIGISFENDGRPGKPTFAVIGRQVTENESTVKKYMLNTANPDASGVVEMSQGSQTLEDVSFVQTTSKTIMTFTKPLNEIFDIPEQIVTDRSTWIYAVGLPNNAWQGSHTIHGKFNLALNPCFTNPWEIANPTVNGGLIDGNALDKRSFYGEKPNKFLWIAHGICLGVAWGLIAPLGLATAFWRPKGPKWAKINQFCNTMTLLMTCAGILLGVIATFLEEEVSHLRTEHSYWGVGVFGGFLVYCMMALYFGAARAQREKRASEERARRKHARVIQQQQQQQQGAARKSKSPDVILGMGDGLEVLPGDSPHNPRNKNKTPKSSLYSDPVAAWEDEDDDDEEIPPEKAGICEWFSRLLFLACIAVAYYTCHTGLEWQLFHFDLDWKYYYWGAGAAGALLLVLLVPLSCCVKDAAEATAGSAADKNVSLGAQDSMALDADQRRTPNNPDDDQNNNQAFFAKGVDEDTYYQSDDPGDASTYDGTMNTNYLEDGEARSPIRESWDLSDTCCL